MATMAVNTFLKGAVHTNGFVRSFSLRSLAEMDISTANSFLM